MNRQQTIEHIWNTIRPALLNKPFIRQFMNFINDDIEYLNGKTAVKAFKHMDTFCRMIYPRVLQEFREVWVEYDFMPVIGNNGGFTDDFNFKHGDYEDAYYNSRTHWCRQFLTQNYKYMAYCLYPHLMYQHLPLSYPRGYTPNIH